MFNAFVLIRNLESAAERLDFGEFTIGRVGNQFKELRELFSSADVNRDDWILDKSYTVPPPGPPGSPVGGIPNDIEWIQRRQAELLDCEYFHVVFTVPEEIASI